MMGGPEGPVFTIVVCVLTAALLIASPAPVRAQALTARLSTLLTQQQSTETFIPDVAAAEATRDTVAGLFLTELVTLPVAASAGGFVYRVNPQLGVVERASDGFGPFFTERALRNSRGQMAVGLTYQFASFRSLQGAALDAGTFPTNAARIAGSAQPFSVDTLQLELDARTTTGFATYGVTDKFSVGVTVPVARVRFSGTRVRTTNGQSVLQSTQSGASTGLGDIAASARYLIAGPGIKGITLGGDVRFPTGRQEDLLGAGDASVRGLAIASWEEGPLAVHVNGGASAGGVSREFFWGSATTFAAAPRVTLIGEVMGRYTSKLSRVQDVYQPHPLMPGVETMRWLTSEQGIHTTFLVVGSKWNVAKSWLLNANLLVRVTDAGLRARVTPAISVDYAFERP